MPVSRRRRLNQVTPHQWPRLPANSAKWPQELRTWAEALLRVLELRDDLAFGIQDNGTDMPLRAILDFIGATVTDDLTNDRTQVSIGGGAGAAPVNATYLVVSLNGTLSAERVLVAGAGLASTDGGANGNFTIDVGTGTGISVGANDVGLDTASTRNTDHAGVVLTAGDGLTGGGDITTSRTFAVVPSYANTLMLMGA